MPLSLSGTTGIVTGNIAASNITTATIADNNVTTAKILNANVTPAKLSQPMTLETAKAYNWNGLTTNTSLDFTGIPSWVKRVTVIFNGVSTNSNNALQVKLGTSSGLESTGYVGTVSGLLPTSSNAQNMGTTGFDTYSNVAAALNIGQMVITTVGSNVWIASYNISNSGATYLINVGNGNKTLSGTLDRVRVTTTSGTDIFDAGSVNIMYEG